MNAGRAAPARQNEGMPRLPRAIPRTISEITRRDIFDMLTLGHTDWAGRLEEPDYFHEHLRRIDAGLSNDPPAAIPSSSPRAR
jgi:hypothetical protein